MTFEEFADLRLTDLLRFATVLCGSRALGEDVVQDVMVRAHQRWARIGEADSPFAYVRTMVVHEHLAWRRKWVRQIPVADPEPAAALDHAGAVADRDELARSLVELPMRQRTAVVLRYYGGLSDPEIADAMGCSAGAVRSYLSKALSRLRIELRQPAGQEA